MTFTASLLLDIVALLILVYFFILGLRRGLILTLFSLLSVLLALGGGWYLSHTYTAPLQEKLAPLIIEKLIFHETETQNAALLPQDQNTQADSIQTESPNLTDRFSTSVQEQLNQSVHSIQDATIQELGTAIAHTAAKSILFFSGFLMVSLLWYILCHALHLVAKLPGLHILNKTLGGVLGLVKGILILLLMRWLLCDLLGWIPTSVLEGSYILPFLSSIPFFLGYTGSVPGTISLPQVSPASIIHI